jgi:hypothetical protein
VQFGLVVEIDGRIYDCVNSISVDHERDSFLAVNISFIPQALEMVNHDSDSWEKLLKTKQTTIRLVNG